jgi:hypothetical protein
MLPPLIPYPFVVTIDGGMFLLVGWDIFHMCVVAKSNHGLNFFFPFDGCILKAISRIYNIQ